MSVRQCKTCPWRVAIVPARDVPDYDPGIYDRMRATLRSGLASILDDKRVIMECHCGGPGEKRPCAGWLHHQLGAGGNLSVRMDVISGRLPIPKVRGKQHESLDGLDDKDAK